MYQTLTLTQHLKRCTNTVSVSKRVPSSSHAASPSSNPSSISSWAAVPSTPRRVDINTITRRDIKTTAPLERGSTDRISSSVRADKVIQRHKETCPMSSISALVLQSSTHKRASSNMTLPRHQTRLPFTHQYEHFCRQNKGGYMASKIFARWSCLEYCSIL